MTYSLQRQLIKTTLLSSFVVGVILLFVVMLTNIWQTTTWQDELMEESATLLISVDYANKAQRKRLAELQGLMQEFELQYQLSFNGMVLNDVEDQPVFHNISAKHEAFSTRWVDGQLWRIYQLQHDDQLTLTMVQPWHIRYGLVLTPLFYGFLLCLVMWGLLAVFNSWLIRRAFQPFQKIQQEIQSKSIQDLQPIQLPKVSELQPMTEALNELLLRLAQAIESEQRFTADASHELRTPLSALRMRLQLFQRKYSNDNVMTSDVQKMLFDIDRATNLIENLLLLAKLDPKLHAELNLKTHDLNQMIESTISNVQEITQARGLNFQCSFKGSALIVVDAALIQIVLQNLLENAIKYALENTPIVIETNQLPHGVTLSISNQSLAMDEEQIDQLAQRFYRIKAHAEHMQMQGSGLGLSIVSKILNLHGIQHNFSYCTEKHIFKVELKFQRLRVDDTSKL